MSNIAEVTERLGRRIVELEAENARLRTQVERGDALAEAVWNVSSAELIAGGERCRAEFHPLVNLCLAYRAANTEGE